MSWWPDGVRGACLLQMAQWDYNKAIHGAGARLFCMTKNSDTSQPLVTHWSSVLIFIGAGMAVAFQIGKVPAALPTLQEELGLSLIQSSWVVAIFSAVAALVAVFLGGFTQRIGAGPTILIGMTLTAGAGILGGFSQSGTFLLATRFLEGLGFVMTITSAPSLIMEVAAPRNRKASLALWGMYMPLGTGLMLALSGPLLVWSDWRGLWWITAAMIVIMIVPTLIASRPIMQNNRRSRPEIDYGAGGLRHAFQPGPLLLSLIFGLYASQYLIIVGFLPILLIELNGLGAFAAATVCAIVVFLNAGGNALSGWFHNRNYRFSTLVLTGTIGMGICGALIFVPELDASWRIASAAGFSLIAGLVPSSLFSEMPRHAPQPGALSAITGLLFQGAAIGQFLGPPAAAALVAGFGTWFAAIPLMVLSAIAVAVCVLCLEFQSNAPA